MTSDEDKGRKPRILICTPEVTELPEGMGNAANYVRAKGGGLGDISAGLVRYLYEDDRFELHVALPKYDLMFAELAKVGPRELDVLTPILHREGIHLVADSAFCRLGDVYDEDAEHSRMRRAEAFQRHIINYLLDTIRPDVVHCNDWMTGLVPAAARVRGIKSLFTLHNVFTEKETGNQIQQSGIDVHRLFQWLYFDSFPDNSRSNWASNPVDFLATGIYAADFVNTVSSRFLEEIADGAFHEIIPPSVVTTVRQKIAEGAACGIQNAPNDSVDPRVSRCIIPYDVDDVFEKKQQNKHLFQEAMGLDLEPDAPLFFWPHRLYAQKGPELLLDVAKRCIERDGIQIAVVARGANSIVRAFEGLASAHRGKLAILPFREDLSELGNAASDFMLMPSRYEPSGLPQMAGPRFGTIPVARLTGGIAGTVFPLNAEEDQGNGFGFEAFSAAALEDAIQRALAFYNLPTHIRRRNLRRIMKESFESFNLAGTASHYISVYEKLIGMR